MNLKISPIMMVLLLSFGVSSINFSLAEENIAGMNNEVTNVSENEVVEETEALDTVIINDPVATYNGIPISKEAFLDYMEGQTGMRSDAFYDDGSLKLAIENYVIALYKLEQVEALGIADLQDNSEIAKFIEESLIVKVKQGTISIVESDFNDRKTKIKDIPLKSLENFIKATNLQVQFDSVEESPELQAYYQNIYKNHAALYSLLVEKVDINDIISSSGYKAIMLNFWNNAYNEYYLSHLDVPSQEEVDALYLEHAKEQDFNQYKLSHIYLDDKNLAESLLKDIQEGKISFVEAVKEHSLHQSSKDYDGKIQQGLWISFIDSNEPLAIAVRSRQEKGLCPDVVDANMPGYYHIVYIDDFEKKPIPEEYLENKNLKNKVWQNGQIEQLDDQILKKYEIKINI